MKDLYPASVCDLEEKPAELAAMTWPPANESWGTYCIA